MAAPAATISEMEDGIGGREPWSEKGVRLAQKMQVAHAFL
jgi:hypothetical protein